MSKFIELHTQDKKRISVDIFSIRCISEEENGTEIHLTGVMGSQKDFFIPVFPVTESYDEVMSKVRDAEAGYE